MHWFPCAYLNHRSNPVGCNFVCVHVQCTENQICHTFVLVHDMQSIYMYMYWFMLCRARGCTWDCPSRPKLRMWPMGMVRCPDVCVIGVHKGYGTFVGCCLYVATTVSYMIIIEYASAWWKGVMGQQNSHGTLHVHVAGVHSTMHPSLVPGCCVHPNCCQITI